MSSQRKSLWLLLPLAAWLLWQYGSPQHSTDPAKKPARQSSAAVTAPVGTHTAASAFAQGLSDVQISGSGRVIKTLPDDNHGSRHQRFILRLDDSQTLLVAHNIDLAPRLNGLKKGDSVAFYGEYEYNGQGGVLHWTHRDPKGRHADGWLEYQGRRYQ